MKKLLISLIIVFSTMILVAQAQVKDDVPALTSPNNENVIYRIFPTTNIFIT
jgi:hypothetical protein